MATQIAPVTDRIHPLTELERLTYHVVEAYQAGHDHVAIDFAAQAEAIGDRRCSDSDKSVPLYVILMASQRTFCLKAMVRSRCPWMVRWRQYDLALHGDMLDYGMWQRLMMVFFFGGFGNRLDDRP